MKLLTAAIAKSIPGIYETEKVPDTEKMAVVKFFNPCGGGTWYAFEADALIDVANETWRPLKDIGLKGALDVKFFGYVTGMGFNELGYFLLSDLENAKLPMGLKIERDLYYPPESFATIQA